MADAPTDVRIRAYNVGFGDCFLMTFSYATGRARHVLIDFGSTMLPKTGGPTDLTEVANQIATDCSGQLDMVVATHRHADHISGFGGPSGDIIKGLNPALTLQPWTERPDLAPDATGPGPAAAGTGAASPAGNKGLVARLSDMHAVAEAVAASAARMKTAEGVPAALAAQLQFLGESNIANRDAVETLQQLGKRQVYASFGTKLALDRILPGVTVDVIGPPTVDQSSSITHEAARNATEFWQLAATNPTAPGGGPVPLFPGARKMRTPSQEARWLIPQIDRMDADEQLAIVRSLDDAMNNTSLILVFDIGGTLLLFPGDAQIENWQYALQDAPNAAEIRERLKGTRLYKVGHHGSLNATPKSLLWEGFANKGPAKAEDRLITVMSTLLGKHGSTARNTEVPRRTLVAELDKFSDLYTTQTDTTAAAFWRDVSLTF